MGRPIIGITGELDAARWGDWLREAVISPVSYIRAVDRSGGAPVVLPPVPPPSVAAYIATFDGLVFAGGRDLDPANYDQQRGDDTDEPEHRRDRFELALMRGALEAGVPFLAIGRGLHVLTVARGGTLTQDLPGHRTDRARYLPHDVALSPESLLGGLLGTRIMVPAAHHQAPYRVGDGLTVAGWSPDGEVTEALEVVDHLLHCGDDTSARRQRTPYPFEQRLDVVEGVVVELRPAGKRTGSQVGQRGGKTAPGPGPRPTAAGRTS